MNYYSHIQSERLRAASRYFIGRDAEIAAITDYLDRADLAPVCLIHGMAGYGKTELALKMAESLGSRFRRQILVEIGSEPNDLHGKIAILQRVISMLTACAMPLSDDLDALQQQYCGLLENENVLVVADNVQYRSQLHILRPPAGCALLVTSRDSLPNEHGANASVELGMLSPDQAMRLVLNIHQPIGAQAEQLAKLCDYQPLALIIVARGLRKTPAQAIGVYLERLRAHKQRLERLRLQPEGGAWADSDSHSGIAAAINLSYQLLSPAQKRGLLQISVIVASFTRSMAQTVLGLGNYDLLESLTHCGLLVWDAERKRYTMHNLVRSFALRLLNHRESARCMKRYLEHTIAVASAVGQRVFQPYQRPQALQSLDRERPHLDMAWAWLLERATNPTYAAQLIVLASTMADIHMLRPWPREELLMRHIAWLRATRLLGDRDAEIRALIKLGQVYCLRGTHRAALETLHIACKLASQQSNYAAQVMALQFASVAWLALDDCEQAIESYQQITSNRITALRIIADPSSCSVPRSCRQTGDASVFNQLMLMRQCYRVWQNPSGELAVLVHAGALASGSGIYVAALGIYENALALVAIQGNRYIEAQIRIQRGAIYNRIGDHQAALADLEQALVIADALGSRPLQGLARIFMGQYCLLRSKYLEARNWIEQGLAISQLVKNQASEALALYFRGMLELAYDRSSRALEDVLRAEEIAHKIDNQLLLTDIHRLLAAVYCATGNISKAFTCCYRSLDTARLLQNPVAFGMGMWALGLIHQKDGALETAVRVFQLTKKLALDMDNVFLSSLVFKSLADIYLKQGQYALACEHLDQLLEYTVITGNTNDYTLTLHILVFVYRLRNQSDPALERYKRLLSAASSGENSKE
ncbi:tetratricopeptide repeat protein [Herpetosiphon llansteffanensis]|uniref:tetratricopeptide repeat protein n=1 Tax=Herpetosiphon llansteffanensis TaxID=2094568 RepID=UPI0013DFEACC|nr:tetratricopeptide repeat protein [Herpetosiphon llansteffanensis]